MTIKSSSLIPISFPASFIFSHTTMSSCDGSASPDGWLCAKIIVAAEHNNARFITLFGEHSADANEPSH